MNAEEQVKVLTARIARMVSYMELKIEEADWHAVADSAMDIRELEAERGVYNKLLKEASSYVGPTLLNGTKL